MRSLVTGVVALVVLVAASRSSNQPELYLARIARTSPDQIAGLVQRGFDIAGVDLEKNEFFVITDRVGLKQLHGIEGAEPLSSDFLVETLDRSFKTPDDVTAILEKAASDFPELATVQSIGKSTEGRDIYAIRLTDSFTTPDEGKSVVLFDAMHHAREVMTPEIALDIIDKLTTGFASDPQVQKWLQQNEVWVVPMVNPDGNNRVWNSSNMWRKNTRGGYGVDINRNYPYRWGACKGSSGSARSETYRGPSVASEPETQALMNLTKQIQPVFNVSYHSFSELVIYPYGCPNHALPAAQKGLVEGIGKQLASLLPRDSGSGTYRPGTSYQLLYPVDGGSTDWMYDEAKVVAYTIEVNSKSAGFQPSFSRWRDSTVDRNRKGWQFILNRTSGPAIKVATTAGADIRVETQDGKLVLNKSANARGYAHFVVEPGAYRVGRGTGRGTAQTVTVGSEPAVVMVE